MPQKIRDIAVRVGSYTDSQGNDKGRWQNVGALMRGDDGNEFIILQRWFNPAGVPNPDDRESVILSCFALRDQRGDQSASAQSSGAAQDPPANGQPDDGVPF